MHAAIALAAGSPWRTPLAQTTIRNINPSALFRTTQAIHEQHELRDSGQAPAICACRIVPRCLGWAHQAKRIGGGGGAKPPRPCPCVRVSVPKVYRTCPVVQTASAATTSHSPMSWRRKFGCWVLPSRRQVPVVPWPHGSHGANSLGRRHGAGGPTAGAGGGARLHAPGLQLPTPQRPRPRPCTVHSRAPLQPSLSVHRPSSRPGRAAPPLSPTAGSRRVRYRADGAPYHSPAATERPYMCATSVRVQGTPRRLASWSAPQSRTSRHETFRNW